MLGFVFVCLKPAITKNKRRQNASYTMSVVNLSEDKYLISMDTGNSNTCTAYDLIKYAGTWFNQEDTGYF